MENEGLKALKHMGAYNLEMGNRVCDLPNYPIIEKGLKALEIIQEKNVAITMIKQTNSIFEYNLFANEFIQIKRIDKDKYKLSPQPLTEKEYDLLKEVLTNGN